MKAADAVHAVSQSNLKDFTGMSPLQPLVSIVIPVYNGSDYLAEAIDSALAQTYAPLEVVVVNDGSQDDGATEQIARSYGDRIRYFSKPNGGVASALNFAIRHMQGSYFSWLSHDDLYLPDKISRQVEVLAQQAPSRIIVYGDAAVFTDDPSVAQPIRMSHAEPEQFRYFLTVENGLHGCTLLIPRVAFDECGFFDESLRTTQDYDMWFRLASRFRFIHLPFLAVKARRHAAQGTITMKATVLAECNQLLAGFADKLTDAELAACAGPSSHAYIALAESLERRGFGQAARHTLSLVKTSVKGGNSISRFALGASLSSEVLIIRIRWFFGSLKMSIRNLKASLARWLGGWH